MAKRLQQLSATATVEDMVAAIETDGGVILQQALDPTQVAALTNELSPHIAAGRTGNNDFAGHNTVRIGALLAKAKASHNLALHGRVNAVCSRYLAPYCDGYQLHFSQAVSIGPGESAQALHRDRAVWGSHVPRSIETQLSTIWALTEFTAANGATRIVPGSHRWADDREPEDSEIAVAEMAAGSVLVYNGSVLHGGGANETDERRLGALIHYTLNWLRQEENQYLSCPPDLARTFSPELRSLIGYSQGGFVLGFYSPQGEPGTTRELVPPEYLFGEKPVSFAQTER